MTKEAIEALVQKVQALPDSYARQTALDLVQAVMDLHAAGLERMMDVLADLDTGGAAFDAFAADGLVSSLLLLHDLHPLDLETRVTRALDRPGVELLSTANGVVRVRVKGGPGLREAVQTALMEAAPDAVDIQVEGGAPVSGGFVPLTALVAG